MARKKPDYSCKLRPREHIIADRAVNFVERQALFGNAWVERMIRDYGVDLLLFTHRDNGEIEPGLVMLQIKATERLRWHKGGTRASFRIDRADLIGWLAEGWPIMLIVYEVEADRAFWLHVQAYFDDLPDFSLFTAGEKITIHLEAAQVFDPAAIPEMAAIRDRTRTGGLP